MLINQNLVLNPLSLSSKKKVPGKERERHVTAETIAAALVFLTNPRMDPKKDTIKKIKLAALDAGEKV